MNYNNEKPISNDNRPMRDPFEDPPLANNSQNAAVIFEERKFYRDEVYKSFIFQEDNLIDFWNRVDYYGRIDKKGMPIICNERYLKAITSVKGDSNPLAMNFVADAFDDFSTAMNRLRQTSPGTVSEESLLFPVEAVSGWTSPREGYANWMSNYFDVYANTYLKIRQEESNRITSFAGFVDSLFNFIQDNLADIPIAFSSYVLSRWSPITTNGLVIDVYEGNSSDDKSKFESFLTDPNYEIYRRLAREHGFLVDKNIPWRLVANLNHPHMLKKQKLNGFFGDKNNLDQIFKLGYTNPHREDIELLRIHFGGFYRALIESFPEVVSYKETICNGKRTVKTIKTKREPLKDAFYANGQLNKNSSYIREYGDLFWLRAYLYFKLYEVTSGEITLKEVDSRMSRYYDIYRVRGFTKVVDEINTMTFFRTTLRGIRQKTNENPYGES